MKFRRIVKAAVLTLFVVLLGTAALRSPAVESADLFLLLDPSLAILTMIASGTLAAWGAAAVCVVAVTVLTGRIFCGYICPMGILIDTGTRSFAEPGVRFEDEKTPRRIKFYFLAFLAGAAVFGTGFVFWGSPLSLVTRFFGLVVYPVCAFGFDHLMTAVRPVAESLDIREIMFLQPPSPRFTTQLAVLCMFIIIFGLSKRAARFWCRYLCPSGAILAMASKRPVVRRMTNEECTSCGKCVKSCPMGAIPAEDPSRTAHSECIVCRTCEFICPFNAVKFGSGAGEPDGSRVSLSRRRFIGYGMAGAGTAFVSMTGLYAPYPKAGEGRVAADLIRPPGAVPESGLLQRCVRCGECMAACPTNAIQPVWFESGFLGLFSPSLTPGRGYCDPECAKCGHVCPTGAIRPLTYSERIWAKTGSAVIDRGKCLAWEQQKPCMVCDEVCPYDAVVFRKEAGNPVAAPHVNADKCGGCGFCEHFCPVENQAAIRVTPMGEIRLNEGSYREEGIKKGLSLRLKPKTAYGAPEAAGQYESAPGFDGAGTAPGFDDPGTAPGFEPLE